jgi:hypothetical protein
MFKIKDLELDVDIECAYLDAFVDNNELFFGLNIQTKERDDVFDGYSVIFQSNGLVKFKPGEISQWQDIAGKTVEWEDFYEEDDLEEDDDDEEEYEYEFHPQAYVNIFKDGAVHHVKIEFVKDGGSVVVKIKGRCVCYDDKGNSEDVPIQIETEVYFRGIMCGDRINKQEYINEIKPFMDVNTLKYYEDKYLKLGFMIPKDADMTLYE